MSNIWEDSRFSNLIGDSRFKNLSKHKHQTKIDKRFKSMFDDLKFKPKQGVDKYGRPFINSENDDLRKFYDIDSEESEESDKEAEKEANLEEKAINEINIEEIEKVGDELSNDGIILSKDMKNKLLAKVDFARGEGRILDSSSDEDSSEEEDDEVEHEFWGEIENDVQETKESTKRFAICNMDWDQVKASDIMILCHSFLPVGGTIICVKILVSEFGKKCLKEEETSGPLDIIKLGKEDKSNNLEISENDDSEDEGDSYHMEKLRQYQINKLKYYYAIVECDSIESAEKLYEECDGLEYESTSTKLDLRFVPNDMSFDDEDIKEQCNDMPSNLSSYKPHLQPVTALQQAKVKVTWDETTIERKEVFEKLSSGKFNELTNEELKKFINCSDEDSDEEENENTVEVSGENNSEHISKKDNIFKYKLLLNNIKEKESQKMKNKYEMEYTWGIDTPVNKKPGTNKNIKKNSDDGGYSSDDIPSGIDLNDPYFAEELGNCSKKGKKHNKNQKKNQENDSDETKTNELKLLLNDYNDESTEKSNRKSTKKNKRKRKDEAEAMKKVKIEELNHNTKDNFELNVKDKRFENLYTTTSYSIDPNNPRFKKTSGMDSIIQEKVKRRNKNDIAKKFN